MGRPAALLAVAACAYAPGDVANPLARKLTWFSYLGGDDIRAACAPGAPDRFRLIYNGNWREQVRVYELGFSGPRNFYWTAASCHAGAFHLTGWLYPSDAFAALTFPRQLLDFD